MPDVSYRISLDYPRDPRTGDSFPGLWTGVGRPGNKSELAVHCHLDSGAELSLFDGQIALGIGLELRRGEVKAYGASSGATFLARLHRIRLSHVELGEHELRVGFSEQPIARNLLGRDFLRLFQIGFWESPSTLLFTPEG